MVSELVKQFKNHRETNETGLTLGTVNIDLMLQLATSFVDRGRKKAARDNATHRVASVSD